MRQKINKKLKRSAIAQSRRFFFLFSECAPFFITLAEDEHRMEIKKSNLVDECGGIAAIDLLERPLAVIVVLEILQMPSPAVDVRSNLEKMVGELRSYQEQKIANKKKVSYDAETIIDMINI